MACKAACSQWRWDVQCLVAAPCAWVVTWFCDMNAGGRLSDAVARACHLLCAADAAFGRKLNTR